MLQAQKRPVHIYMEANPNPNSLKFVANFMLVEDGVSFDYPDAASAENSQLARELFNFAAVQRVFIASNFVTVTKTPKILLYPVIAVISQNSPVIPQLGV